MVGGSTRIPKIRKLVSTFFGGRRLKFDVNPDEAVAHGAVIQAAMLMNPRAFANFKITDVVPLSLGLEALGDIMAVVIPRNTPIPVQKSQLLDTVEDNQTSMRGTVYQGERKIATDNVKLGELRVDSIPKAKRGEVDVEWVFRMDEDGILEVKACPYVGAEFTSVTIKDPCHLPETEIKQMIRKAAAMKESDQKALERAEARNDLYFACYDTRDHLELGDRCKQTLQWLEENQTADVEQLSQMLAHLFDQ